MGGPTTPRERVPAIAFEGMFSLMVVSSRVADAAVKTKKETRVSGILPLVRVDEEINIRVRLVAPLCICEIIYLNQ